MDLYAIVAVDMTTRQKMGFLIHGMEEHTSPEERATLLQKTFHYAIPADLQGKVQLGHLVWVPFGRLKRQGIVVGFDSEAPVPHVKAIEKVAYEQPVLHPYQIELAFWMSREYHAPLWDTLVLLIPPGLLQGTQTWIALHEDAPMPPLRSAERRVIAWLRAQGGRAPLRDIEHLFGSRRRAHQAVATLEQAGLVQREEVEQGARVRPRREKFVHVVLNPERLRRRFRELGRPSKRAEVLEWLAATPHHSAPLDEVCAGVGCRPQLLRDMAQDGDIRLLPERYMVRLALPLKEALAAARGEQQQAVIRFLAEQGGEADIALVRKATHAPPPVLRALVQRGILADAPQPATVELALPPEQLWRRLTELRQSQKYATILRYLQRNPIEMTVAEVRRATGASYDQLRRLAKVGLITIEAREVLRSPLAERTYAPTTPPPLTPDQQAAWEQIRPALHRRDGTVFVLHGVTGSGKTELYLRAVAEVLAQGQQAIVLVPEIALTPQTVARFAGRFGNRIALQHSRLTAGERFDEWRRARDGQADVVVGSRSAIFTPVPNLGLIVIDEEHEWTYKQDAIPGLQAPHYHARDVAEALARLTGATVILGSATPSLEAYVRAKQGRYHLIRMQNRVVRYTSPQDHFRLLVETTNAAPDAPPLAAERLAGELPPVQVVDLRTELRAGHKSIFSRALIEAMRATLAAGEQCILFLNRRGTATFVMCRDCGWVARCDRCDIPLTWHSGQERLICHQCSTTATRPRICPRCLSTRVKAFGVGTQQVEQVAHELFPHARILRWDRDTALAANAHERILNTFAAGEADILIGTQMIAKGLDLPNVTLVGVVSADTALHLPDFRAAERTFQILTQVAGRAGRSARGGRVIVQTYTPQHYAILAAAEHDYERFARAELSFRRTHAYPPLTRLVKLTFTAPRATAAENAARELAILLRRTLKQLGLPATNVLGPAPAFFARVRGRYRWNIFIRGPEALTLLRASPIPLGWDVDVDPLNVL